MPYVVASGRNVGVYDTWEEVLQQIHNYSDPKFIKFETEEEAENFFKKISTIPMSMYAVAVGRNVGIYETWAECLEQICHYPNAKYKKFFNRQEAERFIQSYSESGFAPYNSTLHDTLREIQVKLEELSARVVNLEVGSKEKLSLGEN